MRTELIDEIQQINPWLGSQNISIFDQASYLPRVQAEKLLQESWDSLCLTLLGPRQAGKTTLGFYLAEQFIKLKRFDSFLYLNCDLLEIRKWLNSGLRFVNQVVDTFDLNKPVIFIDEVQRLETPGLLLKSVIDLKLQLKLMVSGSSQLEIKSKIQEPLTGRQFETLILPLAYEELPNHYHRDMALVDGCYPQITLSNERRILLKKLYQAYIQKDIIEILKVNKPDVMQQLITLLAHASGTLINYQNLARDCQTSVSTIKNYLSILEQTYVIRQIKPFVGNKRQEVISNPICYFIDNGFRNQSLNNFISPTQRTDLGYLIKSAVFQEIYKFRENYFKDFSIHYWRTQNGAEVDFVIKGADDSVLPVEVKYRNFDRPTISKSFRSFVDAYKPLHAVIITSNYMNKVDLDGTAVHFIPFSKLAMLFKLLC